MFNLWIFLITLVVGLVINFIIPRKPIVALKFPNPFNLETVYKDKAGQCYRYTSRNVSCTNDSKSIDFA